MTGLLGIKDHIIVSVLHSYNGNIYRAYEILDLQLPLKVSNKEVVEGLIKNAIKLKTYFERVADEIVRLKDKSNDLPTQVKDVGALMPPPQSIMGMETPYTPVKQNVHPATSRK